MRSIFVLMVIFLAASCSGEKPADSKTDSTHNKAVYESTDHCDSTLFPDYKNNLQELLISVLPKYLADMRMVADSFITEQCAFDSLFCGEIYQKHINLYKSPEGYELFSIGYAYVGSEATMSRNSASLYVFGVRKDGKTIFYDIEEDIVGEIQFTIKGFEVVNGKYIVWGESYLYFAHEYGKFKLTVDGREKKWEYMCKSTI